MEWLLQKLWVPRALITLRRLPGDWHMMLGVLLPGLGDTVCGYLSSLVDCQTGWSCFHWIIEITAFLLSLSCLGLIFLSSEWLWGNSPKTYSIHAYVLHIHMSKHIQNSWGVLFADSRWILTKMHMEILLHRTLGQVPPLSVPCFIKCKWQ